VLGTEQLGKKVVHGASYTFLGIALRILTTFGSVAVLARLLTPADFGYLAMASVITSFAALFSNLGFSSVLIQQRIITRLQIDTVFWSSLAVGVFLAAAVFALSFLGSLLFREAIAGELLRVMCVTFAIDALTVPHAALISRLMRFNVDFWIKLSPVVIQAGTAIVFAWNGFGVWSLAYGAIAGSLARTLLYLAVIPYWPRLRFNQSYLASTWKTNASYFGGGLLFYSNSYIDLFLVGRYMGATMLGYYQNARSLTDQIRSQVAVPLQRVLFPAFSSLQNDLPRLQTAVTKSSRLLASLIFPIGIGTAAIADDVVPLLYGDQWLAMIPLVKFLGISIAIRGSTTIAAPIFYSQNKVTLNLKYNFYGSAIVASLILIGINFGTIGVATAVAIGSLYSLFTFKVALGLIDLGWHALFRIIAPPMVAAFAMWGIIEFSRSTISVEIPNSGIHTLLWHVTVGALAYALLVVALSPALLKDAKEVLEKFKRDNK